jgi:hypothetical protein
LAKTGVASPKERAREIWLLSEGAISMILIHGDRSYASAAAEAAKKLIRSELTCKKRHAVRSMPAARKKESETVGNRRRR